MNFVLQLGSTASFERQMATIPVKVKTLHLRMNLLSPAELIAALQSIPTRIRSLSLASNNLQRFNSAELAQIIAAIPAHIRQLDLSDNHLSHVVGLGQTLSRIPATVTHLSLMGNNFRKYTTAELVRLLGGITATVTSLDISNNDLSYNYVGDVRNVKPIDELILIFAALSRSLTHLRLAHSGLCSYTTAELVRAFSAIPANCQLTSIDLMYNDLHLKSDDEIVQIFNSLPQSVTTVICDQRVERLFREMRHAVQTTVRTVGLPVVDVVSLSMDYISGPTIWNELQAKKQLQEQKALGFTPANESNTQFNPAPAALSKMQVR